jgi:iron complex outermembrane receptor protein
VEVLIRTLLLVDGFKLDDVQTGHHSMNLALPIEVIKRIEIIKGPASRVFGQNALQAVNIVTKDRLIMMLHYVFRRVLMASLVLLTAGVSLNESNHILHFQKTYLTDIAIIQISTIKFCIEECFNKNKLPITMLVALSEKSLGQMVLCFASGY